MKILHTVEFYHPSVGGMQEVVKQLSERLISLGHEVTVATTRLPERKFNIINGVQIIDFEVSGNLANGLRGDVDEYQQFLKQSSFDIVTNFAAQQWATDVAITMLGEISGKKVFVPTGFSELYNPTFNDYFEGMKNWLHQYDMNVFLSDNYRDINFARDCGVTKATVIPNGASEVEFLASGSCDLREKLDVSHDDFMVLHVGSHTGKKGHAAAMNIFAGAKINKARLIIIANDYPGGCGLSCQLRAKFYNSKFKIFGIDKRIVVTSLLREDTVAAYKTSDLFLFPSEIECSPLVLFECMASKTPFLSTDVGNSKEIALWSGGGHILPTIVDKNGYSHADESLSQKLVFDLWKDNKKRVRMADAGFASWRERFTWEEIARKYEDLYFMLCENSQ